MTDEHMDARLRAAGERWRDRTDGDTAVAELSDVDEELPPPASPTPPHLVRRRCRRRRGRTHRRADLRLARRTTP